MRDDVFNLANFRFLGPAPTPSVLPATTTPASAANKDLFSNLLAQADRALTGKPYVSPLKREPLPQPVRKPTPTPTSRAIQPGSATEDIFSRKDIVISRPRTPAPVGPAKPEAPQNTQPIDPNVLALNQYPHPNGDNGRGMHWVPTTSQNNVSVDRFVAEAQKMGVKWVTFLNKGDNIGDNDYLVQKLASAGIEPVMRIYSPTLEPLQGDITGMVQHYVSLGVHYFQPYNEPNLNYENPDGKVSVDRYLDNWIPAAKAIIAGGGLPGFGSMAPGGDFDDQKFLQTALDGLKSRGELHTLDRAWLSMHNYTWNHPIQDRGDGDGFFKFRAYNTMVQKALGRSLPIIGTEGGSFVGEQEDPKMAAVTQQMATDWTTQAFSYMKTQREPWLFASSVWTIADQAAGGTDSHFEAQSLFHADGTQSPIVSALSNLA
jgi:hypothetical protein